eukprot:768098-Hanusia_phi.AAC.3
MSMVYSLGRRLYVGLLDEANSCSLMASRGASFSLQSRLRPLPPGYLPEPTEVGDLGSWPSSERHGRWSRQCRRSLTRRGSTIASCLR